VHGYISGSFVQLDELCDPHVVQLIATEVAKWHSTKFTMDPSPTLWATIRKFASNVPEQYEDSGKNRILSELPIDQLVQEIDELERALAKLNSPVVFCHNDLLHKNIIINKQLDKVSFIDFEYATYNPRGFDIGNHFNEYAGFDPDYTLYPLKDRQYMFFESYLAGAGIAVNDANLHKLYVEANQYALASHLFWGFWALVQGQNSDINFGFMEYGAARLNQYLRVKGEYLAIK